MDTFAWELAEPLVDKGKSLYVQGAGVDLENIGQGVWTLQVKEEEEQYEVELLLKGRVFHQVGCECALFGEGKICAHIVVGFFAVLDQRPKKALRNESSTSIPIAKRKVQDFMQMIPVEQQEALVLSFAKRNRRFALLIRATATPYASEEPDKYKQLLYLVIKQAAVHQKISISGLNFINEVVVTILNELKHLLDEGNTGEIYLFADEYLRAWPILMNYDLPEKKKPHISLIQTLQLLERATTVIMAPELIEKIAVMLSKHVPVYTRWSAPVAKKLLALIHKLAKDSTVQDLCAAHLELLFEQEMTYRELADILEVLVGWGRAPSKLMKAVSEYWTENDLQAYCQLAVAHGHFELLETLVHWVKERPVSSRFLQEIEDYQLLIARSKGDENRLALLAEKSFKKTGQVKYYKILKELLQDTWEKDAKRLFDFFAKANQPLPAALLLVDQKAWDELLDFTKREGDLFFLTKVDKYLLKHKPKEIKLLYLDLLSIYFDQHLGDKPVDMFIYLQDHLAEIGYSAFAKEIKAWMRQRYGHRPLLKTVF
ncbi:MAG TPA: hypothetical protein ENK85_06385 [Saprospiraceae bacterium]|nr:hypothetical protein [Saprospiraceae bacterium]